MVTMVTSTVTDTVMAKDRTTVMFTVTVKVKVTVMVTAKGVATCVARAITPVSS